MQLDSSDVAGGLPRCLSLQRDRTRRSGFASLRSPQKRADRRRRPATGLQLGVANAVDVIRAKPRAM